MAYQTSFMCHCRAVQDCAPRFNAEVNMNIPSYKLRVHARNRYYDLLPQFVHRTKGRVQYTPAMPPGNDELGFIGWLPYFNKRWRASTEKLAFKKFGAENGLRMPRYSTQTANDFPACIIKQNHSSFGDRMRGPFGELGRTDEEFRLGENEYYEEFIPGNIAKAWYWDDKLVCLEVMPMPTVTGD